MAKSTAAIEVEVLPKGGADTVVKNFKTQLREAKLEAQQMVITFGEFSDQAIAAQKRVADLSDKMDDFNDRVKALNPDKFAKVQTIVQGVSSGFAAAQGAMALFGSESQDLTKTLVKVQGAMALASGLEGLGKIQQQFTTLAKDGIQAVTKAFSTLRGAIIATGFGALVVALGYVLTNLEKFGLVSESVADKVKKLKDANDKMIASLSEGLKSQELEINLSVLKGNNTLEEGAKQRIQIIKDQNKQIDNETLKVLAERERLRKLGDTIKTDEDRQAEKDLKIQFDKLYNITQENEIKILELNAEIVKQKEEERKKEEEENQKRRDKIKEQNKIEQNLLLERNNAQRQLLVDRLKNDTDILNQQYQNNLISLKEQQRKELSQEGLTNTAKQFINEKYLALTQSVTEKYNKDLVAVNKKTEDETKANRDKFIAADLKQIQEQFEKEIEYVKERDKNLEDQTSTRKQIAELEIKSLQAQLDEKKKFGITDIALSEQITQKKNELADKEIEKAKQIRDAKMKSAADYFSAFSTFNDAESQQAQNAFDMRMEQLKQQGYSEEQITQMKDAELQKQDERLRQSFELNKVVQVASALMNTYEGVTAALAIKEQLYPGQRFIEAGAALAIGLANVYKIQQMQYKSTMPTSGGSASAGRQNGQGMMQSFAPRMSTLNTNESLTQNRKIYVTEGDITRTQRRVSNNQAISVVE